MEIKNIISSGLLELYATGLASEQEAAQVLQWVQQYPEVADELAQIETAMAMYAQANSVQPSPHIKEKIFATINEDATVIPLKNPGKKDKAPIVSISTFWKNVAAASVVLLLGSAVLNFVQYNNNGTLGKKLAQNKELVNNLQDQAKLMEDNWRIVQSRYSQPVTVNGLPVSPEAQAKVFWMKNTGDVYVDPGNLPEAPKGKQYELWAIVDGVPVNAGIIITTKKGDQYSIQKMKGFGKVDAFAVSLEAESSKPAEKPDLVMAVGKM
ncbi:MAG: anti-sigma factor [Chitinophagaceae bacterium]|nr:anti-sigma factor [Chitinophagaceae bacterium]